MHGMSVFNRLVLPLRSRKVRVALATVMAAFAAEYGFAVREELVLGILGLGMSLILGIAHDQFRLEEPCTIPILLGHFLAVQ